MKIYFMSARAWTEWYSWKYIVHFSLYSEKYLSNVKMKRHGKLLNKILWEKAGETCKRDGDFEFEWM